MPNSDFFTFPFFCVGFVRTVSIGNLRRNRNVEPSWISYLGEDAVYTNFSTPAPEYNMFL